MARKNTGLFISALILAGCGAGNASKPQSPAAASGASLSITAVSQNNLVGLIKQMTGATPVTLNGQQVSLSERYSPLGKENYRKFWTQYFQNLGISVSELAYNTQHSIGESQGHNLEAVLPGKSPDSLVLIVHYDSIGPAGAETSNPGVDDDMTGMAMMMETARLLAAQKPALSYTVRFVAADYEEQDQPKLEGARQYASYLKAKAASAHFQILAAIDDEQTGWNCMTAGRCVDSPNVPTLDIYSCSGDSANYSFPALGDQFAKLVGQLSGPAVNRGCMGANSDHYAMWEIGVPAVMFTEHDALQNDHFDHNGGDTYDKIDVAYYYRLAQMGVALAAQLAGLTPTP